MEEKRNCPDCGTPVEYEIIHGGFPSDVHKSAAQENASMRAALIAHHFTPENFTPERVEALKAKKAVAKKDSPEEAEIVVALVEVGHFAAAVHHLGRFPKSLDDVRDFSYTTDHHVAKHLAHVSWLKVKWGAHEGPCGQPCVMAHSDHPKPHDGTKCGCNAKALAEQEEASIRHGHNPTKD